jgi:hypothetical protein
MRPRHQAHERQVREGLDEVDARCRLTENLEHRPPNVRIGVHRIDDANVRVANDEPCESAGDLAHSRPEALATVGRDEDEALTVEHLGKSARGIVVAGPIPHGRKRIDDGVPRHMDDRWVGALLEQVRTGARGGRKESVADQIGDAAVELFGKRLR